jgi:uncharacterized protein
MEPNYRRCISCRSPGPKAQFLRVIRTPDGSVAIDRGEGRSAYICLSSTCIALAQKKKRLERALKTSVTPEQSVEIFRNLELYCKTLSTKESPVKALRDVL